MFNLFQKMMRVVVEMSNLIYDDYTMHNDEYSTVFRNTKERYSRMYENRINRHVV